MSDVAIDRARNNSLPPTWCVLECPECQESWTVDTQEWSPPLSATWVEWMMVPVLDGHICERLTTPGGES